MTPWRPSLPLALRLNGKRCVVLGAGAEAEGRARDLAALGAEVEWVGAGEDDQAPEGIQLTRRAPAPADLDGAWLAVLTDRDLGLAERLHAAAQERRVWFCAVDQPPYLDFLHLAVAREGALVLAVGTEGEAPGLAQRLRDELARVLAAADLAPWLAALAEERRTATGEERRQIVRRWLARLEFAGTLRVSLPQATRPEAGSPAPGTQATRPEAGSPAPGTQATRPEASSPEPAAHSNEGEPGAPSPARGGR